MCYARGTKWQTYPTLIPPPLPKLSCLGTPLPNATKSVESEVPTGKPTPSLWFTPSASPYRTPLCTDRMTGQLWWMAQVQIKC